MRNWPALLGAPTLALTNLSITYALVTPSCSHQDMKTMHLVTGFTMLLVLWFTFIAWRNWRAGERGTAAERAEDAAAARPAVTAQVAVMVGLLSAVLLLAQWIPQWMLSPCAS